MFALPKYNSSTGADWCSKREHKQKCKFKGQTPGKQKGLNCQATVLERHMAKCSRSYKHKLYAAWLNKTRITANQ